LGRSTFVVGRPTFGIVEVMRVCTQVTQTKTVVSENHTITLL